MKLAVSNIAWELAEEPQIAIVLEQSGLRYVEIAPTKVFEEPTNTTAAERTSYSAFWAKHGISIVAFQSMLFGRPDLQLFGDPGTRREMASILTGFLQLAGELGVRRLVFGSPKNRLVPVSLARREAFEIAAEFFAMLAVKSSENGTCLCIEPNPPSYGCNFVTTAEEGRELVQMVGNDSFGLHLDAAGMVLAGEDAAQEIRNSPDIRHFHVSAPDLGPLAEGMVPHLDIGSALRDVAYEGYISIEMRSSTGVASERVAAAIGLVKRLYSVE